MHMSIHIMINKYIYIYRIKCTSILYTYIFYNYMCEYIWAGVTPNGGLVRESPPNPLNSGLGIIYILPRYTVILIDFSYNSA